MKQSKVVTIILQVVILFAMACSHDKTILPIMGLTIASVSPGSGAEGTIVTMTGTGFSAIPTDNQIKFNGISASVATATMTQLTTTVPAGATTGTISVETNSKVVVGPVFTITTPPVALPVITGMLPTRGQAYTPVTITGENFGTDVTVVKVFFNDKEATILTLNNTTITTTIPSKAGSGIVKVVVKGITYPGPAFSYQTSLIVSTIAGTGVYGFQDGPGASALFGLMIHVTTDSKGNIYVVDQGNFRIRKITPAGMVSTFAGDGDQLHDIYQPNGICTDGNDNVYVSDGCKIKKISPGGTVSILSGTMPYSCYYVDGTPAQAGFTYPYGLVADKSNNIYVADRTSRAVRKVDPSGLTSTLAGGTYGDENGTGTAAKFYYPHASAIDKNGILYLYDDGSAKIKKITPSGEVSTFVGSTYGHKDGVGIAAKINIINAICLDPISGNIYFGESATGVDSVYLRMITPSGEVKTLMGNAGGHADGSEKTAKFHIIDGIACDPNGILYVTEESPWVRKIVME